jgi:hypothetical protein
MGKIVIRDRTIFAAKVVNSTEINPPFGDGVVINPSGSNNQ